jgi:hypothetical protein
MRYILVVLGVIGTPAGLFAAIFGDDLMKPCGVPMAIVAGLSFVIGLATCDIVNAIEGLGQQRRS